MSNLLLGRTVVAARPMSPPELEREGWRVLPGQGPPVVLVFDDGTTLYAAESADRPSFPGLLCGTTPDGRAFGLRYEAEPEDKGPPGLGPVAAKRTATTGGRGRARRNPRRRVEVDLLAEPDPSDVSC